MREAKGLTWVLPLLTFGIVAIAAAQRPSTPAMPGTLKGANEQTGQRLRELEPKIETKRWLDVLEELQRIIDEAGDDLIPADDGQFLPARSVARRMLTNLPAEGQQIYRTRHDGQARLLLARAKSTRDRVLLERIGREYFLTAAAEEAGLLLGDLSLDRGEFDRAERAWRSIPTSPTNAASLQGRLILLDILRHRFDVVNPAIDRFRRDFPDATGYLAGKDGKIAEILTTAFAQERNRAEEPSRAFLEAHWDTFAANPARTGMIRDGLPLYWPTLPNWERPIPAENAPRNRIPTIGDQHPRTLAFFPVIMEDRVYVADACRIFAWDLLEPGEPVLIHDVRNAARKVSTPLQVPVSGSPRFTLTTAEGMLFARLGATSTPALDGASVNWLVGLGTVRNVEQLIPFWHLPPPEAEAIWEGAPVIVDGRLYAAYSRLTGDRLQTSIACFTGLHQSGELPELVWKREVISTPTNPNDSHERHELLTLAGSQLIFCSHTGAIVAVETANGAPVWAYRYPRTETPSSSFRDLCPPVYEDGRIFVAPTDSDHLFCLDVATGRRLWERTGLEVVQLLGIANGRLIVTTDGPLRGIRGLNVQDGSDQAPHGWTQHDEGGLTTFGRGLIAGERVFWPTRQGVFVLAAKTGEPLRPVLSDMSGNLTFARGVLVITTPTHIKAYISERRLLPQREKAARGDDPIAQYRLAIALADAGKTEEAIRVFGTVEQSGMPSLSQWASQRRAALEPDALARSASDETGMPIASALRDLKNADPTLADTEAQAASKEPGARVDRLLRRYPTSPWLRGMVMNRPDWQTLADPLQVLAEARALLAAVRITPDADLAASAWITLARAYEKLRDFPAATAVWQRLAAEMPTRTIPQLDPQRTVASWVREHLAKRTPIPELPLLPELGVPLERTWSIKLTRFEQPLLELDGPTASLICATDTGACCRRTDTGAILWERELPFTPSTARTHVDTALLMGPDGLAMIAATSGELLWYLHAPPVESIAFRTADEPTPRRKWSSFQLAGTRLIARYGEDRLVAIDLESGWIDWWLSATNAGQGGFRPHLQATADAVLVQKYDGRVWIVNMADGALRQERHSLGNDARGARSARVPWAEPAIVLDEFRVILAHDAEQILLLDLRDGKAVWTHTIPGESSLTGACPRIRRFGNHLLMAVERNHGIELDCLNIETGKRTWPRPLGFVGQAVQLDAAVMWEENVVLPIGSQITALRFDGGRQVWATVPPGYAPGRKFRLASTRSGILVFSDREHSHGFIFEHQIINRLPSSLGWGKQLAFRLLHDVTAGYHKWTEHEFAVVVLHPRDGQPMQRLRFAGGGGTATCRVGTAHAVVAFGGQLWGLK